MPLFLDKTQVLKHRYAYDSMDEAGQPVQIGTYTWIQDFKANRQKKFPDA